MRIPDRILLLVEFLHRIANQDHDRKNAQDRSKRKVQAVECGDDNAIGPMLPFAKKQTGSQSESARNKEPKTDKQVEPFHHGE